MIIQNEREREGMREAGKHLAEVLRALEKEIRPGVSVASLNEKAEARIRAYGDTPAFLNYTPEGVARPFPATLCVAVNDVVVHGIPTEKNTVLQQGDIIGIDTGLVHNGFIVDSGLTVPVGLIDTRAQELIRVTEEALYAGIAMARVGNTVGDIGFAIQEYVRPYKFGIVKELCGHGVGAHIHEEPSIPNYGRQGEGAKLVEGMVIAIEPMVNEGSARVIFEDDDYTVRTADGKRSAHFEHTLIVGKGEPEIVTERR
jgi:methionyl aminopeptidase